MNLRKTLVLSNILLLISVSFLPAIDGLIMDNGELSVGNNSEKSIIYIRASSPYDYGFKAGKLYRLKYKILDLLFLFTKNDNSIEESVEDQISSLEKYCPDFLEELRGLSDSTGIKIERLLEIQRYISSIFRTQCSITASTSPATKNNETFLTQNWDVEAPFLFIKLIYTSIKTYFPHICHITSNYKYVYLGLPILDEIFLINERGLSWGAIYTALTDNESRHIDEGDGIPTYLLEKRTMMTCANVSEVANLWKTSERAANKNRIFPNQWDFSSIVWCDKEGGILMIEQSHNHIITVFGNSTDITGASEGILWHSFHHQWIDPNLTGSAYPDELATSPIRANRLLELLEDNHGNITLAVCKSIMRDHGGGFDPTKPDSADICWHYFPRDQKVRTAFSWITEPEKLTVHLTHRIPCRSIYWRYNFTRIFSRFN